MRRSGSKEYRLAIEGAAKRTSGAVGARGPAVTNLDRVTNDDVSRMIKEGEASAVSGPQVQELDPSSPNFGKFYPIVGIDS